MKSCFCEVFDDIVLRSTEAILEKRGRTFRRSTEPQPVIDDEYVGGLVAFEGPHIRGTLLAISTFRTAARLRAPERRDTDASSKGAMNRIVIRDYMGEFANLLVGRIKNRLLGFDVTFGIGSPFPLSGRGLAVGLRVSSTARHFTFRHGGSNRRQPDRRTPSVVDKSSYNGRTPRTRGRRH